MTPAPDVPGASDAEISLTRIFNGPRDLVFRLWTDPRYVALWWGVVGSTNPTCHMDVRPGGVWRIDMRTASGTVYPNGGEYLEVVQNERLVYTDVPVASSPAWKESAPGVAVHTITFEDYGDQTKVTLRARFASAADRDRLVALGIKEGLAQSFDRLERLVEDVSTKPRNDVS